MSGSLRNAELFGVTETSATIHVQTEVDTEVEILLDGDVRALSGGGREVRAERIEGLEPGRRYGLELRPRGGPPLEPDRYLPASLETPSAPAGVVASFATLNDLHFGETRFGGTMTEDHEYGEEAEGFPQIRAEDTEVPYWRFMNEDAIDEINDAGVDLAIIKGDIADRGLPHQFEAAADAFSRFRMEHHAFLGNHDYYGRLVGEVVDGYQLLGQPPAPRTVELGGWRLVLLETTDPGEHHGVFEEERLSWLDGALSESREAGEPTLVFMHHHPVPPEHADSYPNTIGIRPEHSLRLFDLVGSHRHVKGVLIGHTHRNRVRRYPASGAVPWVEVNCTKDYPGGWAHYRLFEDGSFRQEVRRTSSERALAHSARAAGCFRGYYRDFALGSLEARSFTAGGPSD